VQLGGSARAYLAHLPLRLHPGIVGYHGTMASAFWIFMQAIVSLEYALMPR